MNLWLPGFRPDPGARLQVVCFHCAGGAVWSFRPWMKALAPKIQICPVQLPGRFGHRARRPYPSLHHLLDDVEAAVDPVLGENFVLVGHSLGALLAYALVLRWQSSGHRLPRALFPLAHVAPQLHPHEPDLPHLDDQALLARMTALNGIPAELLAHPELLGPILHTAREDLRLHASFIPPEGSRIEVPIWVAAGTRDDGLPMAMIEGWRDQGPNVRVEFFDGDHFFPFRSAPFFERLCEELRRYAD